MARLFRYVALGDSTATGVGAAGVGYPELLYRKMKGLGWNAGILNLGQSGSVSSDVAEYQIGKAASVFPDVVTLGIGGNDLWRLVSPDRFRANLARIADALAQTPAQILVSNLIDFGHVPIAKGAMGVMGIPPGAISARVAALNGAIAELAQRPRFTVVDLHSLGEAELAAHPEFFSDDGFHPSLAGYQRWADLLFPSLAAAHSTYTALQKSAGGVGNL